MTRLDDRFGSDRSRTEVAAKSHGSRGELAEKSQKSPSKVPTKVPTKVRAKSQQSRTEVAEKSQQSASRAAAGGGAR